MVKAKAKGPFASVWPDGMGFAPAPESIIEVDDADVARVAHLRALAAGGLAEILEDTQPSITPAIPSEEVSVAALRAEAEALGVKVDGRWSASRLEQEIARAAKARVE